MRFIVPPQEVEKQYAPIPGRPDPRQGPPACTLAITACALCSEDPRFCGHHEW
jgi:hypothetical protein